MDYKKYSLEQLENWVHDAVNGDASPHEIYSLIRGVVKENLDHHKEYYQKCLGLYELLSGHRPMENEDKILKWQLPVEEDGNTGEYFVSFPDDLLEAADLKEGDQIYWVDNGDGTWMIRKSTKPLGMDEC